MRSKSGEQPTVDKLNLGGKQSEKPMVTSGRGPEKEKKVLTMAEYIKKDELLKFKADIYDEDGHVLYAVPTGYIVAMQPADVAPVRHGRWIDKGEYAVCTECGGRSGTQYDGVEPIPLMTQFCQNCGAKMGEGAY